MQEYRISREEMLHWCSIPKEELAQHPESKVQHFIMKKERQEAMNVAADMMCEELVRNNAAGRPTKWVLGSGPADHYPRFIERVNRERISLKNLYARIQAVWRRSDHDLKPLAEKFSWNAGDLVIDYNRKEVLKKGETISLTPIEWKILSAFTRYPQKVFTRDELIASAFDTDFSGYDRVIDTHIKNLRKKIEDDPKNPIYLCTVHGIGYKFGGNIQ